jgi:hypothetical protein
MTDFGKCVTVKGRQFYVTGTFRGVTYKLTGRFGFVRVGKVPARIAMVAEGRGPNGEISWADSFGNFYVCPGDGFYPASETEIINIFEQPVMAVE